MSSTTPPVLSVCVVTGGFPLRTERCVATLIEQECAGEIEILVVDVSAEGLDFAQKQHPAVRVLRQPAARTYSEPRTLALDEARAPLLAYVEDHAYVGPGWASTLLRAFDDPANAVVVYGFGNANPKSWISQMFLLMAYGRWMTPAPEAPIPFGPGNNVAYRCDKLRKLRSQLPSLLDTEMLLQRELTALGGQVWHAPQARAYHENWHSLWGCELDLRICCRQFAAHRIYYERMSMLRRFVYAGGMVLMPCLHLARLGQSLRRDPGLLWQLILFSPPMFVLYIFASIAEAAGYLFGIGEYDWKRLEVEVFIRRDMA